MRRHRPQDPAGQGSRVTQVRGPQGEEAVFTLNTCASPKGMAHFPGNIPLLEGENMPPEGSQESKGGGGGPQLRSPEFTQVISGGMDTRDRACLVYTHQEPMT